MLTSPTQLCPSKVGLNLDLSARGWEGLVRAGRGSGRDWSHILEGARSLAA